MCCCANPRVLNIAWFWSSISRWEKAELGLVQKKTTGMSKIALANPPTCEKKIRKGMYGKVLQNRVCHGDMEKNNNFALSTRVREQLMKLLGTSSK